MTRSGRIEIANETLIAGWAIDTEQCDCPVELLLDGRPFVTVRAHIDRPEVRRDHGRLRSGFAFNIAPRLAESIPSDSLVEARFENGEQLAGSGTLRIGQAEADLFTLMARGWAVSPKSGGIYRPIGLSDAWATSMGKTYSHCRAAFREKCGRELFVAYGTLLGLAREGSFLAHDDDFDAGFLSHATDLPGIADDFLQVASQLRDAGMLVDPSDQGSFHLTAPGFTGKIDVFVFGLLEGRLLAYKVFAPVPRDSIEPTTELAYLDVSYAAPANSDAVLAAIYGDWRVPNKHFQWRTDAATEDMMAKLKDEIRARRGAHRFA